MTLDMTYEDGLPVGKRRQWSGKCALYQVDHFKRGKLDGKLSIWHSYPGQLKERSHFKLGERDGLSETWTSGGMMVRKHEHVAGKRHGESSGWHPNSQRAFETYWFHGKPDRKVLAWHPSGAPAVIGAYTEGRKVKLGCYDVQGKKAGCKAIKDAIWDEW